MRRTAIAFIVLAGFAAVASTGAAPARASSLEMCSGRTRLYATIGGLQDVATKRTKATSVVARLYLNDGDQHVGQVYLDDAGIRWVDITTADVAQARRLRTQLKIGDSTTMPAPLADDVLFEPPLKIAPCREQ